MATSLSQMSPWPRGSHDPTVERALRAEVREAVSRLLSDTQWLTPSVADEARIRALIHEHVVAYQRRAATANTGLLFNPEAVEQRLFDGLLRMGILQPLMDAPSVEEIICNGPQRIFVIENGQQKLYFYEHIDSEYDVTFGEPIENLQDLEDDHAMCNYFATLCAQTSDPSGCYAMAGGADGCNPG